MKELWKAFVARIVYWLTPKPPAPVIMQTPEPPLKPGTCECGHRRCNYVNGRGKCICALFKPDENHSGWWGECACTVFILDKDDDDDGDDEPETSSPEELEKLWQK